MLTRVFSAVTIVAIAAATATAQDVAAPAAAPLPIVVSTSIPEPALTRADTARAVHELFKSRRGGAASWLGLGTASMLASILPAQQSTSAGVWTPGVVAGTVFLGIGLNKSVQFWWSQEQRVLRALATTGHLPPNIRRRLKGNFLPLHGTASEQNPLLALDIPAPLTPTPGASGPDTPAPIAPAPASQLVRSLPPEQALADARQDTLDAVQGFFNARRTGGQLPILLALPGLRLMTGSGASNGSSGSPYVSQPAEPSGGQVAAGLLLAAGGLTYMFVHNAPYSDEKFNELRTSYLAGVPLPAAIRVRLKEKHLAAGRTYRARLERKAARRRR